MSTAANAAALQDLKDQDALETTAIGKLGTNLQGATARILATIAALVALQNNPPAGGIQASDLAPITADLQSHTTALSGIADQVAALDPDSTTGTGTGTPASSTVSLTAPGSAFGIGAAVALSAVVAGSVSGSVAPTGTVVFKANGTPLGDPVPLDATGTAELTTSFTTAGAQALTAEYSGDAGNAASVSSEVDITVS